MNFEVIKMLTHLKINEVYNGMEVYEIKNLRGVKLQRGKYSSLKKLKNNHTEGYILQVGNIFKSKNTILSTRTGVYIIWVKNIFNCRNDHFSQFSQR